jgi:hypothetical protein
MMMVDTINPNDSKPDQFGPATTPAQPPVSPASPDRFYGGFDKPEEVRVNLVPSATEPTGFTETPPVQNVPSPGVMDNMGAPKSQITPTPMESQIHTSYTNKSPVNTRGVLVIVGIGIVATLVFSLATFFILGATNADKVAKQQAQLDELNQKLAGLTATPTALSLPEVETPTATTPEVTETTPEATPEATETTPAVENTTPTISPATEDGRQAAG